MAQQGQRPRLEHARRRDAFLRAALVGLLAGGLAVLFRWSLYWAEGLRVSALEWLHPHPWGILVLPLVGLLLGCLVGVATVRFAPDASGSGIPHVKGVLLHVKRLDWRRLLPVKFGGGVLGIGAGLSLGREGPTVQMGAAVGQLVGEYTGVRRRGLGHLVACGAGAGLAGAFHAPLAGFIFVLEELKRELSPLTYGSALIASVCADVVARALAGQTPSFEIRGYPAPPLAALPLVLLLGILAGLLGSLFARGVVAANSWHRSVTKLPRWLLPGLACALCGGVAWFLPRTVGGGQPATQELLQGHHPHALSFLATLLVVKFVLTLASYASGAPGGIFAPMLMLGAVLGVLVGDLCAPLAGDLLPDSAALGVLGMAAFFSAAVRAPLTGIVLILEMTGNYEQLLALCVVCLSAYLVAERLGGRPVYEALLDRDLLERRFPDLGRGEPSLQDVAVEAGSAMDGALVRELPLPQGVLLATVTRAGNSFLPRGATRLRAGDLVQALVQVEEAAAHLELARLGRKLG